MCAVRGFAFLSAALLFTSGACRADLFEAAKQGDAGAVRAALAEGALPDVRDEEGRTPLHRAAEGGHVEAIQLLLDAGADANAEDREYGSRPLYYAVSGGHAPAAKLLLERGAAVDAINHTRDPVSAGSVENLTAVSKASEMGRTDLVALLLDRGADATGHGDGGWPLLLAMSRGHVEPMRLLLDHGADVNATGWNGATLLHLTGEPELVKLLLARGANASVRDDEGVTPLHVAAVMARLEAAQLLLDAGADVNARDREGWTPLHYTALASRKAKYFCLDLTKMLLRYGADPGARDRDGNTPLHLGASGKTGLAAAALLLEARPDPEDRNNEGDTLLHAAAALGCTEWAFVLLEKGADPRVRNWRDEAPLHLAARNDLCDLAERLLDLGAGVDDPNTDGDTPLHLAGKGRAWTRYGDPATPTLYRNVKPYGVSPRDDYGLRTEASQFVLELYGWPTDRPSGATVESLLRRGADPNAGDKAGGAPLRYALTVALSDARCTGVTPRTANTLSALMAGGADPNVPDVNGDRPLHLTAQGLPDALQMLLERGADANARNAWWDTPLYSAAAAAGDAEARGDRAFPDNVERVVQRIAQCVRLLIEHGADANLRNGRGDDTPLHVAVASGGTASVVQALLDGHADIDAPNSRGETPLQLAIMEREKGDLLVEPLRARGAK